MIMIHHLKTDMRGFQRWMKEHPRKRTDGYFSFGGKELTHEQIKRIVDYAVKKGYRTDADIPANEVERLLKEQNKNKQEPLALF